MKRNGQPINLKLKWFKNPTENQKTFPLMDSYGDWEKLKRITATIIRAKLHFMRSPNRETGRLSLFEIQSAGNYLICEDQTRTFKKEKEIVKMGSKTQIASLVIFWDNELNFIRIDGRVQNEYLSIDERYPILLSKDGALAKLLIRDAHYKLGHGGNQPMMQYLRKKYWITGVGTMIKDFVKKCPICFKLRMQTSEQLMSTLPAYRTTPKRAFLRIGIDYAGPFTLRPNLLRGKQPRIKVYLAVFVCLVTRAVHLELVSDASTSAFRRMIARRGAVSVVVSDNGSNFIGANNFLQKIINEINNGTNIYNMENEFNLKWTFITPSWRNLRSSCKICKISLKSNHRRQHDNV